MFRPWYIATSPQPSVMDQSLESAFFSAGKLNLKGVAETDTSAVLLAMLRTLLDISDRNLSYVDFFNCPQENLLIEYVGMIFSDTKITNVTACQYCNRFRNLISTVFKEAGAKPPIFPTISLGKDADNIAQCIDRYKSLVINSDKYEFYQGWVANSKDGISISWSLAPFYSHYGKIEAARLWNVFQGKSAITRGKTLKLIRDNLISIINTTINLCPSINEYRGATSKAHIDDLVRAIFAEQKLDCLEKNSSMPVFYKRWSHKVQLIESLLIKSGLWSEPRYELHRPKFKQSSTHANTHKHLDESGNAFNDKLITCVPLSYSDDEAVIELLNQIEADIEHVSFSCRTATQQIMTGFRKRKELEAQGEVKFLGSETDMTVTANQCATWAHYKYSSPLAANKSLRYFMKIKGDFANEYGLLTGFTLYPFLYLLVEQHPKITDSWLTNFELFDKNGKQTGYRQVGESWVATSVKFRRGPKLAEQAIILTDTAKDLMDNVLALTAEARVWLQAQGRDDYRFLLLSAMNGYTKPRRITALHTFYSGNLENSLMRRVLAAPTIKTSPQKVLAILNNLSLTSMRASCGIRVYLQTKSVKAMSEALGHYEYNPKALSHYLPDPILRFFQSRWIRIYQNALFYEALKDNDILLDVLDFGEEELALFLENHRLKPLPEHVANGYLPELETSKATGLPQAVIPISVPLLRVMQGLVLLINDAPPHQHITSTAMDYYEISQYVTDGIESGYLIFDDDIKDAWNEAKASPLDRDLFKRGVYAGT